ncbi:MAG TPA: D-aminoacylase [Candidatus Dormibacteraeota bacterium]|nr:D-aminoacylase [Candidatus Dormibacteraeota bacterium]
MSADIVLRGGTVHDGLGSPGRVADVVIAEGRVTDVGRFDGTARETVDCDGLIVAPGFLDPHAHSDLVHATTEPQPFKIAQGVTTEIVGNCGFSFAPLTRAALDQLGDIWTELAGGGEVRERTTFAGFLDELEESAPANNVAAMVGHNALRAVANGVDVELRPGALERMRELAAEAFDAGAAGFSTGLIYVPGCYADTDEVVAMAQVAARYGRPYTTHMRDEGAHLAEALDEALAVGRRAGVRVQVSHCKVAGVRNHGGAGALLDRIAAARREGVDVLGDQYPYTAGSTLLAALLPTSASEGGTGALRTRLASHDARATLRGVAESGAVGAGVWRDCRPRDVLLVAHRDASVVGRRLDELSGESDPWDRLCDLVLADPSALIVLEMMAEDDVVRIMGDPLIGVGSDSGPPVGLQHPRTWGCFPRVLGTYVRERGVLTWEQAIRKMTSLTARTFGLAGRGQLLPGMVADVCAFDPARIGHAGTYERPDVAPDGVELVLLGGRVALRSGQPSDARLGRVLRAGRG